MGSSANSLGAAYVEIVGDPTKLLASLNAGVGSATAGGQQIASAFTGAVAPSSQLNSAVQALQRALTELNQTTIQSITLYDQFGRVAYQSAENIARAASTTAEAAKHSLSEFQAVSGTVRTALDEGAIRPVERLIALIPGIGPVLQTAFPLIGVIALGETLSRVIDKFHETSKAEKDLKEESDKLDSEIARLSHHIQETDLAIWGLEFGRIAEAGKKAADAVASLNTQTDRNIEAGAKLVLATALEKQARIQEASTAAPTGLGIAPGFAEKLKLSAKEVQNARDQLNAAQIKVTDDQRDQTKDFLTLQTMLLEDTEKKNNQRVQEENQATSALHQAAAERLRGEEEAFAAYSATHKLSLNDERTFWANVLEAAEAGTENADKIQLKLSEIGKRQQEAVAQIAKAGAAEIEKAAKKAEQQQAFLSRMAVEATESLDKLHQLVNDSGIRIQEAQAKGAGEQSELGIQRQKIALEAAYGEQVSHSLKQKLDYMGQIADLENQENLAKVVDLATQLRVAESAGDTAHDMQKIVDLQNQLNNAAAAAHTAQIKAAGAKGKTAAEGGFGATLGADLGGGVESLSAALAKGVTDGGKNLGKDLTNSLKQVGEHLFSDILAKSFDQLIVAITGQTIAQNLNTLWLQIKAGVAAIGFGFAEGTNSAPGGWSWVGEKGPELMHVPQGSTIIPNHKVRGYADGKAGSLLSANYSSGDTHLHFHAHGITNPGHFTDHVMRELPRRLKGRYPGFSPASS